MRRTAATTGRPTRRDRAAPTRGTEPRDSRRPQQMDQPSRDPVEGREGQTREIVMGYDMHWKTKPAGEEEAVAAARELFYAACNVRDALPDGSRGTYTDEEWKRIKAG